MKMNSTIIYQIATKIYQIGRFKDLQNFYQSATKIYQIGN